MTHHFRFPNPVANPSRLAVLLLSLSIPAVPVGSSLDARETSLTQAGAQSDAQTRQRIKSLPLTSQDMNVASPVDADATAETRRLHTNLALLAYREGFAFGMQGDHHGGVGWDDRHDDIGIVPESDLYNVAGVDAGISGYNVNWLFDASNNADLNAIRMVGEEVRAAHARGEIITFHWPMTNPETGIDDRNCPGCSHLIDTVLSPNLQGRQGRNYTTWKRWMDVFADFLANEAWFHKNGVRTRIPILFRPWHEMNQGEDGRGRWYQVANNSLEEYGALWRQTVTYLRDRRGTHQLLFVYAPSLNALACDGCDPNRAYIENYPGDEWVDVMAGDGYFAGIDDSTRLMNVATGIRVIADTAIAHRKIPALSETGFKDGLQHDVDHDFWYAQWLPSMRGLSGPSLNRMAYVMTWSNSGSRKAPSFFVPYLPDSAEANDFRAFRDDRATLFANDLLGIFNGAP